MKKFLSVLVLIFLLNLVKISIVGAENSCSCLKYNLCYKSSGEDNCEQMKIFCESSFLDSPLEGEYKENSDLCQKTDAIMEMPIDFFSGSCLTKINDGTEKTDFSCNPNLNFNQCLKTGPQISTWCADTKRCDSDNCQELVGKNNIVFADSPVSTSDLTATESSISDININLVASQESDDDDSLELKDDEKTITTQNQNLSQTENNAIKNFLLFSGILFFILVLFSTYKLISVKNKDRTTFPDRRNLIIGALGLLLVLIIYFYLNK